MYRRGFIIFVLVLSASVVPTYSQLRGATEQCQVSGQIRLSQGGGPVNEVIVRLEALGSGPVGEVRTDRLGKFRFEHLSPIQYRLVIRHPGFKEIQREVNLVMVSSEYVQIQLVADSSSRSDAPSTAKSIDANVPADAQKEFEKADASLLNASRKEHAESQQSKNGSDEPGPAGQRHAHHGHALGAQVERGGDEVQSAHQRGDTEDGNTGDPQISAQLLTRPGAGQSAERSVARPAV